MLTRTEIQTQMFAKPGSPPIRWRISDNQVPYEQAVAEMELEVAAIANGEADELIWLLEHPPLYTAGTSANASDLIEPDRVPRHPEQGTNRPIAIEHEAALTRAVASVRPAEE